MRAKVTVRLKPAVLDPQGEAVQHALGSLGFDGVRDVRVAKLVELDVDGADEGEVRARVEEMADQLLRNPVIEDFTVEVGGDR